MPTPTGHIQLGFCSAILITAGVYWLRSHPTVQALAVRLHRTSRVHQTVGAVTLSTTLLSLLGLGALFYTPLASVVPIPLLGRLLLIGIPLTGGVLALYLHIEFFAAVAVFQHLPDDLWGDLPGQGASRYQTWMYLIHAHHENTPLAGPGAGLALLGTSLEAITLASPLLVGLLLGLTVHVWLLSFVMGADNGTLHHTHDDDAREAIDTRVAARREGQLLSDSP